jgi:hypothetical protein
VAPLVARIGTAILIFKLWQLGTTAQFPGCRGRTTSSSPGAGFQSLPHVRGSIALDDVKASAQLAKGVSNFFNDNFVILFCCMQITPK